MGDQQYGIDSSRLADYASEIKQIVEICQKKVVYIVRFLTFTISDTKCLDSYIVCSTQDC